MASVFDLITDHWEHPIEDRQLRLLVWRCNCNGALATDFPRPRREDPPAFDSLTDLVKAAESAPAS